ncbi:MAG TPA: hypothetical protein VFX96_10395, partial [Pyrinomonadaceae bacterium]|nr:hypothetical protein [Pyrinomonadaceae bacterium]
MIRRSTLLPAILIIVSVAAAAPSFKPTQDGAKTAVTSKTLACAGAEVEYEGVRFTCDPALAAEVRAEIFAASPLLSKADKPDYVAPERVSFTFDGPQTRRRVETYFGPPQITVARLEGFAQAHALEPDYVSNFQARAAEIKKLLADRPKSFKDGVPFLPYVEGAQEFQKHISYFNFRNGKAVAFVTHFSSEPSLITN